MRVWLAMDRYPEPEGGPPYLNRVALSPRPFTDADAPPGPRGALFEFRGPVDVDDAVWEELLAARLTPDEQDELHRRLWSSAGDGWPT